MQLTTFSRSAVRTVEGRNASINHMNAAALDSRPFMGEKRTVLIRRAIKEPNIERKFDIKTILLPPLIRFNFLTRFLCVKMLEAKITRNLNGIRKATLRDVHATDRRKKR